MAAALTNKGERASQPNQGGERPHRLPLPRVARRPRREASPASMQTSAAANTGQLGHGMTVQCQKACVTPRCATESERLHMMSVRCLCARVCACEMRGAGVGACYRYCRFGECYPASQYPIASLLHALLAARCMHAGHRAVRPLEWPTAHCLWLLRVRSTDVHGDRVCVTAVCTCAGYSIGIAYSIRWGLYCLHIHAACTSATGVSEVAKNAIHQSSEQDR